MVGIKDATNTRSLHLVPSFTACLFFFIIELQCIAVNENSVFSFKENVKTNWILLSSLIGASSVYTFSQYSPKFQSLGSVSFIYLFILGIIIIFLTRIKLIKYESKDLQVVKTYNKF